MAKFNLLADYLRGQRLLTPENTYRPGKCRDNWLNQTHSPDYLARFINNTLTRDEQRQMNLP
ncbi:MAG: hypothetical protein WD601_01110 [Pseudohongiellaceae bacterium]